jgi:hypothetical protein
MSQFNAPVRRRGGDIDVYTGILCAAVLVLLTGVLLLATANIEHSRTSGQSGSMFKLVD